MKTPQILRYLFTLMFFFGCSEMKKNKTDNANSLLKDTIKSYVKEQEKVGFKGTVLVGKNNKIVFNNAYGDSNFKTTTAFYIASMSKQFTATAILKLQEEGKLSINDSITKFISYIPEDKKGITIHHLLTHSSGLGNNYPLDGITNRNEAINLVLSSNLKYEIGEKFSYSAEGYNLLAIIIELVSGQTFEDYISQHLLSPANLTQTGFWGMEKDGENTIAPFNDLEILNALPEKVYNKGICITNYGYKGGTGLYSTTQDLFKWLNVIKNNKILKESNTQRFFKPYTNVRGDAINGTFYGYGWFVQNQEGKLKEIRHGGSEDGAHNGIIRFYDNGYVIIVLSNSWADRLEGKLNGIEWSTVLSMGIRDILNKVKNENE